MAKMEFWGDFQGGVKNCKNLGDVVKDSPLLQVSHICKTAGIKNPSEI